MDKPLRVEQIEDLVIANITDITASAAELNLLDGVTATTTELNYIDGVTSAIQTQLNGKLANIVEDTTPQLGGELDAQGNNIIDLGDVTFQTGATGGTLRTGTSNADKFELQAYDVNDSVYRKVLEVDAGNLPQLEVFADSFAIWDNADETKQLFFTLSGGTTGVTTEMVHSPTANRVITLPDATDTLVGKATTDTLTNKTFDANGTGNSISNIETADLAAAAKTGVDTSVVTGTAGTNGDLAQWNVDGDLVDGPTPPTGAIVGTTDAQTLTNKDISNANNTYRTASATVTGAVELATTAETNTGTDTTRALTADGLAGSYAGTKSLSVQVFDGATDVTTGDGKAYVTIPESLNGMNLVRAQATVVTAGTTNATTVMIHNLTDASDMLSGAISIASGGTVGTVGTISGTEDDVATNDILRIDVDSVSTTAPTGLMVVLEFRLP